MGTKENKQQTAVEWFYDNIKSHFEHDGDLLETLTFTMAIAKKKESEQLIKFALEFATEIENRDAYLEKKTINDLLNEFVGGNVC